MFKIITVLVVISQCCSPSVFGSPVKDGNCPHYLEVEMERLKPFAEELSKTIDTSVEPCNDYISYVGGHGEDNTEYMITMDQKFIKTLYQSYFKGKNHLTPSEVKAKSFFEICHDNRKEIDFLAFVKDLNSPDIGPFPPGVTDWNNDKFDMCASIATFNRIEQNIVFEFKTRVKDDKRVFYLNPTLSGDSFLADEPEEFAKVYEYFGFTSDEIATVKADFTELQEHIKGIGTSEDYQIVTIDWMKENIPDFDWVQYFHIVGCGVFKETDEFYVKTDSIKNVIELLTKTNKKKVINYIFYSMYRHVYGVQKQVLSTDKEYCYEGTMALFTDVFINIALKKYLNHHDKVNYINVTESVIKSLKNQNTDEFFLLRHDQFMKIITDPSNFEKTVENTYKNIEVSSDNVFVNVLRIAYNVIKSSFVNSYLLDLNEYILKNLHFNHNKPRLFMAYYFIKEINYIYPPFESDGKQCIDLETQQKKLKNGLKTLDYLKESNAEVFENEKQFLEKYQLNQNKVLLKLLTESYISYNGNFTTTRKSELENLIFSLDEFITEYKCPNEKLFKLDDKVIGKDYCLA